MNMETKFMRMMLFFDLPSVSEVDKKNYLKFSKFLKNNGFIMMQFSIYTKIVMTTHNVNYYKSKVYKNAPNQGNIRILVVTEKQYNSMELVIGNKSFSEEFNDDNRMKVIE